MTLIKTLDQIKEIKKSNQIIARLYNDILPKYIKPGVTTYELDKIVEKKLKSIKTKKKLSRFIVFLFIIVFAYTAASWKIEELYVYGWLNQLLIVLGILSFIFLISGQMNSKAQKQLKAFSYSQSKHISSDLSTFKAIIKKDSVASKEEEKEEEDK